MVAMSAPQTPQVHRGIVKQILSGDAIVIRDAPKGGPPPEYTIYLSGITAPRLARRPNPSAETATQIKDEPYAWEAREFLRTKLIGKEVAYTKITMPGTGRVYGNVFLSKDAEGEGVTELLVAEGLAEVRRANVKQTDEFHQRLVQLEETAKAAGKGKWSETASEHVRDVTWNIENVRHFVDSYHNQPVDAVIEHVRDGCTFRAFILPSFQYITVMLSGIKCPMFKMEGDKTVPEPYAEEAKFFSEAKLLQREVKIILEGTSASASNQNLLGTVLHPNGNIAEVLLKEGFARCIDWSMGVVTQGADKLRSAEKIGKEKHMRIWKDYQPSSAISEIKDRNYTAKVIEIINGDGMMLKLADGSIRKIFLSSIRSPRPVEPAPTDAAPQKKDPKARSRPLYDIPYMFEAREFLRKKLIGKKVNIQVDYIQPKTDDFPEKNCCTVTSANINVAEALISKGLATAVRYRQDDDHRSSHYDELLAAETRATKKGVGVHSKKTVPHVRVADVSGDLNKSKQFLPFLQRAGRSEAVVEFVASGSRFRLYIPTETCLVTFLLSGISCPRAPRTVTDRSGAAFQSDPFGEEALKFSKELILQREVEVEVESMDKGGNFIGWLFVDGTNLSVALVAEGLSKVHFTAERSNHYRTLCTAEEKAKSSRLNLWADYQEEEQKEVPENDTEERKVKYRNVVVTEVTNDLHFYAQNTDTGPQFEKLMEQLRADMSDNPPLPGAYTPKTRELCAAKFVDNEWYRAKIEKVERNGRVHLLYIDYGNREVTDVTSLAALPSTYTSLPPQAHEYALACALLPPEEEDIENAVEALRNDLLSKECAVNTEYRIGGLEYVSVLVGGDSDVAESLVAEGIVLAEARREKRLAKLVTSYQLAQDKAKSSRLNLWRYGDFTSDDAKEFGYQR